MLSKRDDSRSAFDEREASWSAVAEGQGASLCPVDTAVERGKNDLRPKSTVRHTTAVSR